MAGNRGQYYNRTNTCDKIKKVGFSWRRCDEKLRHANAYREYKFTKGIKVWTGKWLCGNCGRNNNNKIDSNNRNNLLKSIGNRRTENQNPKSNEAKADNSQELACKLYGWEDLNEKYDNYTTPIDCYDPKTGLYHQVQMRYYNSIERYWPFGNFEREWKKIFEDMTCFCISEDGNIVERMYKFPKKEIDKRTGITIQKNPFGYRGIGWYEQYRVTDEETIRKVNDIWKEIIGEKQ